MEMMVWNVVLSGIVGVMGFLLKSKFDELQRISILLNKTREEVAKEYVTKVEVHADINRVLDRLDRLDTKLDRLVAAHKNSGE